MTTKQQTLAIKSDSISLGACMDDCSVCGVWRLLGASGTCIDCTIARENAGIAALRMELAALPEPTWAVTPHDTITTGGRICGTRVDFNGRVIEFTGRLSKREAMRQACEYWQREDSL